MDGAARTVADPVREYDRDRYTAILYAPEDRRDALMALAAFDIELARIPHLVSEPMPGEIRFQWWRDVLQSGASTAGAGNPVAERLGEAIDRFNLPAATLVNMIDARLFDLYSDPMPSRTQLEGYCGETSAAMIQLAALVLDPGKAASHTDAAGHAGCAMGIARILLSLSFQRRRGQCYVPAEMLEAAGLDSAGFVSAEAAEGHLRAISAMLALAREHYREFLELAGRIPGSIRPAFLPVSTLPHILKAVERAGLSALQEQPALSPVRRQWAILRRAIGGW